jgi:AcrR family transcriptional regulator
MVATPWGPSESLRDRRLRPGPGTQPERVVHNQKGRLFGAMVASTSERGYAATRVADLVELSGVSRSTYYGLFPDKAACFLAAMETLLDGALAAVAAGTESEDWEQRAQGALVDFAALVVAQPAAARMCLLEAPAAGPEAMNALAKAMARFETLVLGLLAESPERAAMPEEIVGAWIGGVQEIARERLRRGREDELPDLMPEVAALLLSYRPPPEPLRLRTRLPTPAPETLETYGHAERALRALAFTAAEQGYANTTVNQVVRRASMSPTTFYANFKGKEDALLAAIDSAGAQMVAAILPAFQRNPNWPYGVRGALGDLFNYLASRPALARLVMVEVYAAGPAAMERRAEALKPLQEMIAVGREERALGLSAVALEAIVGGIYGLAYKQIRESGPASLPGIAPTCAYFALAPFIGSEEAGTVANGDGRARGPRRRHESLRAVSTLPLRQRILAFLSFHTASVDEIAAEFDEPVEAIEPELASIRGAELVEEVDRKGADGGVERAYRSSMGPMSYSQWAGFSQAERERISAQIRRLIKRDVEVAVAAGTFDARVDRHLVRVDMAVDEVGWEELAAAYTEAESTMLEIWARSSRRLEAAGKERIQVRGVMTLFEMPPEDS